MFRRWRRYLDKLFDFSQWVGTLRDHRPRPQIPTAAVWLSAFFLFVFRRGSLNAIESDLRTADVWKQLIRPRRPSADTIGRVFSGFDLDSLRRCLIAWVQRLKRNKSLEHGRLEGRIVAALDGHELFASFSRWCPGCCQRHIQATDQVQWYHRIVAVSILGARVHPVIDLEPQHPGEGETTCALRLLKRLLTVAPRLVDAFSFDALYATPALINTLRTYGKHGVIVLKENQPDLLRDAKGIFESQPPSLSYNVGNVQVELWDAEGFTSLIGSQWPLRVVYCRETKHVRRRVAGEWITEELPSEWCWLTTFSQSEISGPTIRLIGRRRWEIENRGFNDLHTHWALDHCFKHDPNAIVAFLLTLAMVHLLMSSFYHFNLKETRRRTLTTIALARMLYRDLIAYTVQHTVPSMIAPAPP